MEFKMTILQNMLSMNGSSKLSIQRFHFALGELFLWNSIRCLLALSGMLIQRNQKNGMDRLCLNSVF